MGGWGGGGLCGKRDAGRGLWGKGCEERTVGKKGCGWGLWRGDCGKKGRGEGTVGKGM